MQEKLIEIVKTLFKEQKIDLFIGFEAGTVPSRSRPFIINSEGEVGKLVWNSFCANNLAAYLGAFFKVDAPGGKALAFPKTGIALKGCDMRSVINLVKERQVPRENLLIVGIPCRGMVDRRKVRELAGEDIAGITETDRDQILLTTVSGKELTITREDVVQAACIECRFPDPKGADIYIEAEARKAGDGGYARILEFEKKPLSERWEYFKKEMEKCIRCNACRQACPSCWCKECFADSADHKWIGAGTHPSDIMIFHITRIYHQAGRCVGCDACYNACPMDIDLRTYTKKMVKDVEELFGYFPDFNPDSEQPLGKYDEDDNNDFITDPDKA